MAIRPLNDTVLIKPDTYGSPYNDDPTHKIKMPEKFAVGPYDYSHSGVVVSVGPQVTLQIKRGDKVIYPKFGFAKLQYRDVTYALVKQDDILAVHGS